MVGSSGTQAFAWQAGIWRLLSPESNGSAFANNDVGQVAGYRFPGPEVVVWQDDTVTPAPIGPSFLVQPVEINDHGQVLIQTVSAELRSRALLWEPGGRVTDLGTLGGTSTKAVDVDDRGQILGRVGTTTSSGEIVGHTVLWTARPS